ncbi:MULTISPECIES: MarR family winged helix-turn-helix transcriptional regulator [Mammaliicoccus]|uniref:MarR family transcriptional regulator n=1 Tax=Mammaliicoccus lentus TaxID=42858 RepID=A0ABS6GY79_MAMLE|nr:MarR family transcriptional regulator [Mammaliicoccus lentus]MBF0840723.1 MarR family transcriptional regulator [Mammaliicoccus lentus]MBU6114388.1 MarR family transcriptional regulator [Mammaliicoccus lentus]
MNKVKELNYLMRRVQDRIIWLNKPKMEKELEGYTPSEVHCIEAIKNIQDPNVKKISDEMFMTRGAISKLTKKLIKKNAVESYRKSENKKEIYFRLIEEGERVYQRHLKLHQVFLDRDKPFFDNISDEEFKVLNNFFEKYSDYLDQEIKKEK